LIIRGAAVGEVAVEKQARLFTDKLLELYLALPDTPSRTSRHDRQLAFDLYNRNLSLETIEAAFLLGSARRIFRDPSYSPLAPIRSLHYFLPIIQEVTATPLPKDYILYLRQKLARHSPHKSSPPPLHG